MPAREMLRCLICLVSGLALVFEELDVEEALDAYSQGYNQGLTWQGTAWHLGELIGFDTSNADRGALERFWSAILGEKWTDGPSERLDGRDFAKGFIDGALELWDSIKDQI
jgi:hypothetical protein